MFKVAPWPWLPVELIETIISETWNAPTLSSRERIALTTSFLPVNKTWAAVFTRISFKDAFILSPSHLNQFFRILRGESPIYDKNTRCLADQLCRSITIKVERNHAYRDAGKPLSDLLYTLHSIPYLPNLRTLSVEYVDIGPDDIFDQFRFTSFPTQISTLKLKFSVTSWRADAIGPDYQRRYLAPLFSLPSIRYLSILGANEGFVADIIPICPNMETLKVDTHTRLNAVLPLAKPFASAVNTIVLHGVVPRSFIEDEGDGTSPMTSRMRFIVDLCLSKEGAPTYDLYEGLVSEFSLVLLLSEGCFQVYLEYWDVERMTSVRHNVYSSHYS